MGDEAVYYWHLVGLCCRECPFCAANLEDAPIVILDDEQESSDAAPAQIHDGE